MANNFVSILLGLLMPFNSAGAAFGVNIGSFDELRTQVLCRIAVYMFWFLMSTSVLMILLAAYFYATARDNAEQVRKAHFTILYAAIGIIVAVVAKTFPRILADLIGGSIPPGC